MSQARLSPDHDGIFNDLKNAVVNEAMKRHSWEEKVDTIFCYFLTLTINYYDNI